MRIDTKVETDFSGEDAGSLRTVVDVHYNPGERREVAGRWATRVRISYHQLPEGAQEPDWTYGNIWLDEPVEDGQDVIPFHKGMPGWIDELTAKHSPAERYGRSFVRAIDLPAPK